MRIALSPDENPGDPGAVAADGTRERALNLLVCLSLQHALLRCGQDAWFNPDITYQERVAQANRDGTEVLVACAHNEATDGRTGTQFVFCPGGQQFGRQALAASNVYGELMQLGLVQLPDGTEAVAPHFGGLVVVDGWPARVPDAVESVYEACLFNSDTVYCELLYMSPQDERIWNAPDYAHQAGEAMARGLARTYGFAYVPEQGPPPDTQPTPVTHWKGAKPVTTAFYNGQLHVFWVDGQGHLQHEFFGAGTNGAWYADTPPGSFDPGALLTSDIQFGQLHVFGKSATGKVAHAWYDPSNRAWFADTAGT